MTRSVVRPADAVLPDRPPNAPAPGTELVGHGDHCFGCGRRDDGIGIRFFAGPGISVRSTFVAGDGHQGAPGYLHGGVIMSAFDECLGAPGMLVGLAAMTAHLEVDFRIPVPIGATVTVTSRIDGVSGRKVYASGEARLGADGPVAAVATGLYVRIDPELMTGRG